MTGETGKSLAACRQKEETDGTDCTSSGSVAEIGGCSRKRATAGC